MFLLAHGNIYLSKQIKIKVCKMQHQKNLFIMLPVPDHHFIQTKTFCCKVSFGYSNDTKHLNNRLLHL